MKKLIISFLLIVFFALPVNAQVDYAAEYKEKELFLAAANACLASYDDRVGNIFYAYLSNDGWQLQRLEKETKEADANVFLASKYDQLTGTTTYILAFRGTASAKDFHVDTQWGKVPFLGDTLEKIQENAKKSNKERGIPRVHRGFLKYVLVSFDIDVIDSKEQVSNLEDIIKDDPHANIIVTGHSLGGGAATLYAASLINMGVNAEKIKVITFGAPAVGNRSFAEKYQDEIDLTRIYSIYDPVQNFFQAVHSYSQFGKKFIVNSDPKQNLIQHSMENYADLITKEYYDTRFKAIANGELAPMPQSADVGSGKIVAFAVKTKENIYNLPVYKYAKEYLLDIYRHGFLRYRILPIDDIKDDLPKIKQLALQAGADYLLVANIAVQPIKNQKGWIVSQEQALYNCQNDRFVSLALTSNKINTGASFIQAAAFNSFRGFEQLSGLDIGLRFPDFHLPNH